MRDGICWDAGHVGICGDMRDGPPPRNRPGRAAVFDPHPPPINKGLEIERQTTRKPKKELLFLT